MSNGGSQSFQHLSFEEQRKISNKDLDGPIKRGSVTSRKILSQRAKELIKELLDAGVPESQKNSSEPPYMTPSTDPDDYSHWCSYCSDFGEHIVLCAGCRVGVCVTSHTSRVACLGWQECIAAPDAVFLCHYCSVKKQIPCILPFASRTKEPYKWQPYFRYDPAVLVVSLEWHETANPFGPLFFNHITRRYAGHEDMTYLMRASISEYYDPEERTGVSRAERDRLRCTIEKQTATIKAFLRRYGAAKLIIILDTHSLDNGYFAWTGSSPSTYEACSLQEILTQCLPEDIYQFLDNSPSSPKHAHQSIIVNLACGSSIIQDHSRFSLTQGHCADVISFSTPSTISSLVATELTDFLAQWVQSPSGYDHLVARNMTPEWLEERRPVISTASGHILYTKDSPYISNGMLIKCPNNCNRSVSYRYRSMGIALHCQGCDRRCTVPVGDKQTFLGSKKIVKVKFPLAPFTGTWRNPPAETMLSPTPSPVLPSKHVAPALRHSRSAGLPITDSVALLRFGGTKPRKRRSATDLLELDKKRRK